MYRRTPYTGVDEITTETSYENIYIPTPQKIGTLLLYAALVPTYCAP